MENIPFVVRIYNFLLVYGKQCPPVTIETRVKWRIYIYYIYMVRAYSVIHSACDVIFPHYMFVWAS